MEMEEALRRQPLFPVLDSDGKMCGVVTRGDLIRAHNAYLRAGGRDSRHITDIMRRRPLTAAPDEALRAVVHRMAQTGLTSMPVVAPEKPEKLLGLVSLEDLLEARSRELRDELVRERVLDLRLSHLSRPAPAVHDQAVTGPRA